MRGGGDRPRSPRDLVAEPGPLQDPGLYMLILLEETVDGLCLS